ncbi:MAG: ATP-grasp domain-containing protein, partial [Candidatus Bathyarchaeia archaeon]
IVPLEVGSPTLRACERIVDKLSSRFELRGSNGVDVVISEDGVPYVVEVNPRFQGTIECVERALGLNLVRMHVNACIGGFLPPRLRTPSTFFTRLILYAPERAAAPDLTRFRDVRDIPLPGVIIEGGEPICSVITEGRGRSTSLSRAYSRAGSIYGMLSR